jgi:hypothetical protein
MPRPKGKKEAESLVDLYTEATTENQYLKRAFRVLRQLHPDFINLPLLESHSEKSLADFLAQVRTIASAAMDRKNGTQEPSLEDIPPMYIGLDIPLLFNPITIGTADLFNDEES